MIHRHTHHYAQGKAEAVASAVTSVLNGLIRLVGSTMPVSEAQGKLASMLEDAHAEAQTIAHGFSDNAARSIEEDTALAARLADVEAVERAAARGREQRS